MKVAGNKRSSKSKSNKMLMLILLCRRRDVTVISNRHTCQLPEYKNLETNPKIFKVGAIFICGPLFFGFHFFQYYNSTLPTKLMDKKCKRATVGSSREIWCSNRETGRFHGKLGDSRENRGSWQVCN